MQSYKQFCESIVANDGKDPIIDKLDQLISISNEIGQMAQNQDLSNKIREIVTDWASKKGYHGKMLAGNIIPRNQLYPGHRPSY